MGYLSLLISKCTSHILRGLIVGSDLIIDIFTLPYSKLNSALSRFCHRYKVSLGKKHFFSGCDHVRSTLKTLAGYAQSTPNA
jgi:hypothetical protein